MRKGALLLASAVVLITGSPTLAPATPPMAKMSPSAGAEKIYFWDYPVGPSPYYGFYGSYHPQYFYRPWAYFDGYYPYTCLPHNPYCVYGVPYADW